MVLTDKINLNQRPEAAVWIARCIASWSSIEFQLGLMMTAFLGQSASPTVAIYIKLLAFRTRVEALRAAAQNTIDRDHLDIFEAIISLTSKSAKKRDRFAHHLWSYCEDLPDAVLLIDPRDALPFYSKGITKTLENKAVWGVFISDRDLQIPLNKVLIYTPGDFEEVFDEMVALHGFIVKFCQMVLTKINVHLRDNLYNQLLQEPRIREFVLRARANRNVP